MRISPLFRRLILGLLLLSAVGAGWFLRGAQLLHRHAITGNASVINVLDNTTGQSLPANEADTPSASAIMQNYDEATHSPLFPLTTGLRPGRGDAIPNAEDVKALSVKDVSFSNWRGELLSGWFAFTSPQAPVIILTHGTPGNRVSMIERAAFLYQHGYNVLLFDFQSYGRSQGAMSTLGMVESEDILAAISYVRGKPETTYSKIGVLGLSMGATAAVLAASHSNDITALVAESCPVDATRVKGDVPDEQARHADQVIVQDVYGVDITQARPLDAITKLAGHTAVFFINGDKDGTTPVDGMQALYQAASDPKQSWIVSGADHAQAFAVDKNGYITRVNAFFDAQFTS